MLKRAATYIQVRKDAKTRRGKLKCKPPNRRCGGRCIPPAWDCRLNNEGNDPHLTAAGKGVDVTAGTADLFRGAKKVKKAIVTLDPAELESGRRSISRGVKKLAPGDLQRKQEVQKKVYKAIGMVGAPLTVGILAFAMHRALKGVDSQTGGNFPYRRAMGDRIDNAAVSAVSSLRRNMPLGFGDRYIANEMLARRNVRNTGYGVGQINSVPEPALSRTANTGYLGRQITDDVAGNVLRAQRAITHNGQDPRNIPFDEWERQSRDTFWRTPRQGGHTVPDTDNASGSVFSPKAANNLLRDAFRLNIATDLKPGEEGRAVIGGVRAHLDQTARTVRAAMSQATLNSRDPNDVELYLGRNPLSLTGNADVDARSRALIVGLVTSRDPQAASREANHLYRQTVTGFDQYFGAIAERSSTPPGLDRAAQARSFFTDANRAHSAFLGRASGVRITPTGPGTEAITNKISHAKQALGLRKPRIELTDSEIVNALSELGRSVPPTREGQLSSLNVAYAHSQARFSRVPPETRQYGKAPTSPPPSDGARERPAKRRLRSAAQIVQDLIKAGWGVEAAQAEAAKIVRQRKTDSVDREDKKCGKSGIPEGKKCSKKTLAATGTSKAAEKPKGNLKTAAKIALGAGLLVGGAVLVKKYAFTPKDQADFDKAVQQKVTESFTTRGSWPVTPKGMTQIGKGGDGVVYMSEDKKHVYKKSHNPEKTYPEVVKHLKVQELGVATARIEAYDKAKGVIKMEALPNHKPMNKQPNMTQTARKRAGVELLENITKMHSNNIIHGDLHARNMLVDKAGNVRFIDFAQSYDVGTEAYKTQARGHKQGELASVLDLAESLGYISKDTRKSTYAIGFQLRKKAISIDDAYSQMLDAVRKGEAPKKPPAAMGADEVLIIRDDEDREDKKCGKSGIAEGKKCTKQTATGAAPEPVDKPKIGPKLFKIALIATAVGLSIGTASVAKKYSPELLRTGIEGLSSGAVNSAINSLPKSFQAQAKNLQGDAKRSLAVMSLKADKMEMVGISEQGNFSTWKSPKGAFVSVGSVGDSLLAFYSEPSRAGSSKVPGYNVSFKVDQHYKQKTDVDRKSGVKIAKTIEGMFNEHLKQLPEKALLTATAFDNDGKGAKRDSIYKRKGFTDLYTAKNGLTVIGAFKVKDKIIKPPEDEKERQALWESLHS